jgi:membrane peptidoglycan carboxypeptidase
MFRQRQQQPSRRRRRRRRLRRAAAVAAALALMGIIVSGAFLLVTPSVGNAERLAQAQDRARGVAYPGPPVPTRFAASLIATEDHRFYSEPGIDPFAVGRVIVARLTGGSDQGGATLYQQLAKLLYTPRGSGVTAKAEQVALAVKLDLTYSKAQILQMYADVAYFGHGFYGLAAASCGYFSERPARLSWPQAAMLAGIVQAPSAENPLDHPAAARAREAHVLGRLVATGALTPAEATAALAQPLFRLASKGGSGCGSSG